MPPILLMLVVCAVTAAAAAGSALRRKARSARLAALATTWNMRFTSQDRFQLTARVAARLPMPGAADVVVRDLIYRQEGAGFRYLFTVEYTTGVLRTKRRRIGAGMVVETGQGGEVFSDVTLAPTNLDLREQYEWLWKQVGLDTARERAG
jgi:hypothetical protein